MLILILLFAVFWNKMLMEIAYTVKSISHEWWLVLLGTIPIITWIMYPIYIHWGGTNIGLFIIGGTTVICLIIIGLLAYRRTAKCIKANYYYYLYDSEEKNQMLFNKLVKDTSYDTFIRQRNEHIAEKFQDINQRLDLKPPRPEGRGFL